MLKRTIEPTENPNFYAECEAALRLKEADVSWIKIKRLNHLSLKKWLKVRHHIEKAAKANYYRF